MLRNFIYLQLKSGVLPAIIGYHPTLHTAGRIMLLQCIYYMEYIKLKVIKNWIQNVENYVFICLFIIGISTTSADVKKEKI